MRNKPSKHTLDQLLVGRWPKELLDEVSKIQLNLGAVAEWEENKPPIRLCGSNGELHIDMRVSIPYARIRKIVTVSVVTLSPIVAYIWHTLK